MTNNDVLRKVRYTFDYNDDKMMALFASGGQEVTRAELSEWLKRDEDPDFKSIYDKQLATFLNGFINEKRGKREGEQPTPEKSLNNNIIFRKLKIALNVTDDDIIEMFDMADLKVSKPEISALFRNPNHKHYRLCKDQFLRNFLYGMELKFRQNNV
jgi:uncharacterized protein YehS (DUF1456 family)